MTSLIIPRSVLSFFMSSKITIGTSLMYSMNRQGTIKRVNHVCFEIEGEGEGEE